MPDNILDQNIGVDLAILHHNLIGGQLFFRCIKIQPNPSSLSNELDLKANIILAQNQSVLFDYIKKLAPILRKDLVFNYLPELKSIFD